MYPIAQVTRASRLTVVWSVLRSLWQQTHNVPQRTIIADYARSITFRRVLYTMTGVHYGVLSVDAMYSHMDTS